MKTMDSFGEYLECLQCGYVRDVQPAPAPATTEPMGVLVDFPSSSDDTPLQSA